MRNFFKDTVQIDQFFAIATYILNTVRVIIFMIIIWIFHNFPLQNRFFTIYFSFYCGAKIIVNFLLITGNLFKTKKYNFVRMYLLPVGIFLDVANIVVNIVYYSIGLGNFWFDGYIFVLFDLIMIVAYLRRYLYLHKVRKMICNLKCCE